MEVKNGKQSGKWNFSNEAIAKMNTMTFKALKNHTLDRLFHQSDFEHDYYNYHPEPQFEPDFFNNLWHNKRVYDQLKAKNIMR